MRYTGEFRPIGGAAYFGIYGWMKNPTIEYHIVESYSGHNPSQVTPREYFGAYQSDDATYDVYRHRRVVGLAIDSPIHTIYYSVRRTIKPTGSISGSFPPPITLTLGRRQDLRRRRIN